MPSSSHNKPAWLELLVVLLLVMMAALVGGLAPIPSRSGRWATVLAPLIALGAGVFGWRKGRRNTWWFLLVGLAVYSAAGLLAGGFVHDRWAPRMPLMTLKPLLYPLAGLVWGALLQQAAEQDFLRFLGVRSSSEGADAAEPTDATDKAG